MKSLALLLFIICIANPAISQTIVSRLEAENGILFGNASVNTNQAGFSGTGFIENINTTNSSVSFNLNIPKNGQYFLSIKYANGNTTDASLTIYINNTKIQHTQLPSTGAWNVWKNKTELIALSSGLNTIKYQRDNDNTGSALLDYLWATEDVNNGVVNQPIINQNDEMIVKKLVQLPNTDFGGWFAPPRLNTFAYTGSRNFVGDERSGKIYELINLNGTYIYTTFFDTKDAIVNQTGRNLDVSNLFHGGLRGLAFHPNFSSNGKFYTSIMEERPTDTSSHQYLSDVATPIGADSVLIEWTYDHNSNQVLANSYREVFRVGMPVYDHPIKQITFNPYATSSDADYGLLYIAHGDASVESATAGGGMRNDALGKILRIDPLASNGQPYSIPSNNPFVGDSSYINEIYALGFRNPHTLSFNRNSSGLVNLISGEPGRDNLEEVNIIEIGENYGWPDREGTFEHLEIKNGIIQGCSPLPNDDATNSYRYPAAQYGHIGNIGQGFNGQAIAGGYVYEGNNFKHYIFSDFPMTGQMLYCDYDTMLANKTKLNTNESPTNLQQSQVYEYDLLFNHDNNATTAPIAYTSFQEILALESNYDNSGRADTRFGRDANGTLYILNKRNGWVYQIEDIIPYEEPTLAIDTIKATNWGIYPNPVKANQKLHIEGIDFSEIQEIYLVSLEGKKVPVRLNSNASIEISSLDSGVYILNVMLNDGSELQTKLIVE